jgi:hypothetical protein
MALTYGKAHITELPYLMFHQNLSKDTNEIRTRITLHFNYAYILVLK